MYDTCAIPVRYKAGKRGPVRLVVKPDLFVKAEYDSEHKLDGESMGFQSCKLASNALLQGSFEVAVKLMVQEHLDLMQFGHLGAVKIAPFISAVMFEQAEVELPKPIRTEPIETQAGRVFHVLNSNAALTQKHLPIQGKC